MYVTIVHENGTTTEIVPYPNATISFEHTDQVTGLVVDAKIALAGIADIVVSGRSLAEPDATDAAALKADELGVDLTTVKGTGKDGRVTVTDVEAAAETSDAT